MLCYLKKYHPDFITWVRNHAPAHLNLGVFVVPTSKLIKTNPVISILKKKVLFVLVNHEKIKTVVCIHLSDYVPYESPILGQLLDLIFPPNINISEPRFKSNDP